LAIAIVCLFGVDNEYIAGGSLLLPPVGAVIGFNLTRKYRTPPRMRSVNEQIRATGSLSTGARVMMVPLLRGEF
jgi:hypothetical protein